MATALTLYARLYSNTSPFARDKPDHLSQVEWDALVTRDADRYREGSRALRELSAKLQGHNLCIPWYGLWTFLRIAPSRQRVLLAGANLIGLSNLTPPRDQDDADQNMRWRAEIMRNLGLLKLRTAAPQGDAESRGDTSNRK